MPKCVVKWCRNKTNLKNNVTFHRFPLDAEITNRWISFVQQSRGENDWCPNKHSVICSEHFSDKEMYITKTGNQRLAKDAIPNKYLVLTEKEIKKPTEKLQDQPASNLITQSHFQVERESSCFIEILPSSGSKTDCDPEPELIEDFSDLDSVYDSPSEAQLRKELRRKLLLEQKHKTAIRSLRQNNIQLQKKIVSYKKIISSLKKSSKKCLKVPMN